MSNTLFVLDLDNTIADASRRFAKAGKEPNRDDRDAYITWLENVQSAQSLRKDDQIPGMCDLAWALYKGGDMVYVTSRERKYRGVTQEWLRLEGFPTVPVYMRPDGSWEEAHDLKESIITNIIKDLGDGVIDNVVVLDDDPSGELAKVCKRKGWTMLKAAP